ncbi:MAG: OmpA family protein [Stagnimonas sp.]|nr:OmpA family protein [Stagnimonas sp.]
MLRALLLFAALMGAAQASPVPLVTGLTVTTAIAEASGDYESRKRLMAREDAGWRLSYSTSLPGDDGKPRTLQSERLLHDADLATARGYRSRFEADVEEDYPGTTALGASTAVLQELLASGKSRFALVGEDQWLRSALPALAGGLLAGGGVSFKGELQRQSLGQLSVLVNGTMQMLPVVVASGRFTAKNGQTMDAELQLLNDPANPLALQWRIGKATLRAVRIDYPAATSALSSTLTQKKRVVLPGLYFDFGSATLKPESAAALPAILEAIRAAPKGVLLLEGHTDSIGDAARNQALSLARAEAVRAALIQRDATLAARLKAQGFGSSKPVAANTSLEGRAQNRRVELALP